MCKPIIITSVLPGWIRFEHQRTRRTIDFNPDYDEHRRILIFYSQNPDWRQVPTGAPCDVDECQNAQDSDHE